MKKKLSINHRQKLSIAHKGKKFSAEHIANILKSRNGKTLCKTCHLLIPNSGRFKDGHLPVNIPQVPVLPR